MDPNVPSVPQPCAALPRAGIGFSSAEVKLDRLPGWEPHSYGYHGDDGHAFSGRGTGRAYGPTYTTGGVEPHAALPIAHSRFLAIAPSPSPPAARCSTPPPTIHATALTQSPHPLSSSEGDWVGVVLNRIDGTISFCKKGYDLGVAFSGVGPDERLYPAVGFRTPD